MYTTYHKYMSLRFSVDCYSVAVTITPWLRKGGFAFKDQST